MVPLASFAFLVVLVAMPAGPAPSLPVGSPPWSAWFDKNVMVTDKKTYVHVFWTAQEARQVLSGPDRKQILAQSARQLAVTKIPPKMKADRVKLDVVFVPERDNYGMPRWDTPEKVGHLEFSRQKLADGSGNDSRGLESVHLFDVFEVH